MRLLTRSVLKASAKTSTRSSWLILMEFTIDGNTVRLVDNSVDVSFGGHNYTASSLGLGSAQEASDGQLTSWSITINDVSRILLPLLEAYDGAVGAVVTVIVVNSKLLADNYAELTREFVVKSSSIDANTVTLALGGSNLLIKRCPRRRYKALHCPWRANTVECGQANPCDRTLAGCKANSNTARYGGFLALRTGVLRYV
jgi:phage-related protein